MRFTGGATVNQVSYVKDCSNVSYVATTPLIAKTEDIDNQGNQSGSYQATSGSPTPVPVTITGASKIATAGTGVYSISSGNATGSICPSGWILPSGYQGSSRGQFGTLEFEMGRTGSYQYSTEAPNR